MNELLVERFFSVSVELTDGRSTQLKVRGESPAEVFKDVRARSDVRRVGKVTEINEGAFQSDRPVVSAAPVQARVTERHQGEGHQASRATQAPVAGGEGAMVDPRTPREALMGFAISGPRVVRAARPLGYEQPFKNLKAPAGREAEPLPPEPAKPVFSPFGPAKGPIANDPSRPSVFAKPAAEAPSAEPTAEAPQTDAVDATEADESAATTPNEREYRIVKSRRQTGEPYLLQRGNWGMVKGKRTFGVEWEKGFESREKAEKQQAWLEQMAREAAELEADADE